MNDEVITALMEFGIEKQDGSDMTVADCEKITLDMMEYAEKNGLYFGGGVNIDKGSN